MELSSQILQFMSRNPHFYTYGYQLCQYHQVGLCDNFIALLWKQEIASGIALYGFLSSHCIQLEHDGTYHKYSLAS